MKPLKPLKKSKPHWQSLPDSQMTDFQRSQMAILKLRFLLDRLKVISQSDTFENWPVFIKKYKV